MRTLAKMTWVEIKLFVREPVTVFFVFALPVLMLFVLGEVFGNTPDPEGVVFRGVGPMDFYVPAYIGLVITSIGMLALPVHLAGYRERGVLRRFRASAVSVWTVIGAQVVVMLLIAAVGGTLLAIAASFAYDVRFPDSLVGVIGAFALSALSLSAVGVLLGGVMPTARAAQGAGLLLFFVMFMLGGGGPPREVMTDSMRLVGDFLPLTHVVIVLQDPWNGFAWNGAEVGVVGGIMVGAGLLATRVFRWE